MSSSTFLEPVPGCLAPAFRLRRRELAKRYNDPSWESRTGGNCFDSFTGNKKTADAALRAEWSKENNVEVFDPIPGKRSVKSQPCEAVHGFWRVPTDAVRLRTALGALDEVLDRPDSRVVAVGETGLDRVRARTEADLNLQRDALEAHLALARALDLPVVLHVVRSHAETLASLKRVGLPNAGLQVHGFWGTTELVAAWGRVGAYLSIGRMVTRHPRAKRAAAIAAIPGSRLLVETDVSSQKASGTGNIATRGGRPRPTDVWEVVRAVATIRGERAEDVALQTAENARRLFGLDRASLTPA